MYLIVKCKSKRKNYLYENSGLIFFTHFVPILTGYFPCVPGELGLVPGAGVLLFPGLLLYVLAGEAGEQEAGVSPTEPQDHCQRHPCELVVYKHASLHFGRNRCLLWFILIENNNQF